MAWAKPKVFNAKENYEKEYVARFNSISTLKLPLKIFDNQAFVILLPEMFKTIELININNIAIEALFKALPGSAQESFINECLIDEIMTTNGIEGVHSTRKEIQVAINKNLKKDKVEEKKKRFEGLIKKY